jgi:hypothetical protein
MLSITQPEPVASVQLKIRRLRSLRTAFTIVGLAICLAIFLNHYPELASLLASVEALVYRNITEEIRDLREVTRHTRRQGVDL